MEPISSFPQPQNSFRLLENRERNGLTLEKKWMHDCKIQNIAKEHCFKTYFKDMPSDTCTRIFGPQSHTSSHNNKIGSFQAITDTDHNNLYGVTKALNYSKLWNLKTGEFLKCFNHFQIPPKASVTDKYVIFHGRPLETVITDMKNHVYVYDIPSGQRKTSFCTDMERVCGVGESLFGVLTRGDGIVHEWNSKGNFIQEIAFPRHAYTDLLVSEKYLIQSGATRVAIYNRADSTIKDIDLSFLDKEIQSISSLHLSDSLLFCGFETPHPCSEGKLRSIFCVIDLVKGEVQEVFQNFDGELSNSVTQIIYDKGVVYFGDLSGRVNAVNLAFKDSFEILKHSNPIAYLAYENEILISGSKESGMDDYLQGLASETAIRFAELKFWDAHSRKPLPSMIFPMLSGFAFLDGRVIVAVNKNLIQYDYNGFPNGSILTPNSLPEPS